MNREQTAIFIGHNDCHEITLETLTSSIEQAINNYRIDTFLNGGQGGFDRICARAVCDLKSKYPYIKNYLVIPYFKFRIFDKTLFDEIIYSFDKEIISNYGYKSAIPKRNKWMVDNSSFAICYVSHPSSGAYKTYDYAVKKGFVYDENINILAVYTKVKTDIC